MASRPRLFYNNDASFLHYSSPPMTTDDFVYETVGRFAGTQVDALVCHMFGFGTATPLYPTEVPEAAGIDFEQVDFVEVWRQQEILKGFKAKGQDPWTQAVEVAHSAGIQYWAGMRFNDLHGAIFEWSNEFSLNHPEYKLGEKCGSGLHRPGESCRGLDFTIPEVRAHRLALLEEVCTRYDVDGFEWDFLREPGHHVPDIESGRSVLTDYLREARKVLQRIGEQRGRPLGFGIRVPGTPEKCHDIGLEVESWIKDGLVDIVSPAPYWDTATDLPFDAFVAMARNTSCRVYACTSEQVGPGPYRPAPPETLRAGALNAWHQGVDGIYIFNFHHTTMTNIDDSELFSQLGDLKTLATKNKQYMVAGGHAAVKQYPHGSPMFEAFQHQLPSVLKEWSTGPGHTVRFTVGDDLKMAANRGILDAVILELTVVDFTSEDQFEFRLNGKRLPQGPQLELHPHHYRAGYGHTASNGHYVLRYDLRIGDWIRQGLNELDLVLRRRNPKVRVEFGVHDLRLEINYRTLPMRG